MPTSYITETISSHTHCIPTQFQATYSEEVYGRTISESSTMSPRRVRVEEEARQDIRHSLETIRDMGRVLDEEAVAPADQQAIVDGWGLSRPMFSNTPTRNCNPREEGSDTTIDPTFNNKMDEMILASHVDVKDLWRKK